MKNTLITLWFAGIVLLLSACVGPADIDDFLNDERVQKIIGWVELENNTDDNLQAGSKKITGLNPDKYYLVEELDENDVSQGFFYITKDGIRWKDDLEMIGRVSGGTITGLTNFFTYKVYSAEPLTGNKTLYDLAAPPPPGASSPITIPASGIVSLPAPNDTYYLDLGLDVSPGTWEIVKIPYTPATGISTPVSFVSGSIIKIDQAGGTTFDYVYIKKDTSGDIIVSSFGFLRVTIEKQPEITILVNFSPTGDATWSLSENSISYAQNSTGTIPITVNNAAIFDGGAAGIEWYFDGELKGTGATFTLNRSLIENKMIGVYLITLQAKKGGLSYSTTDMMASRVK